jgi:hypothetical protein
MAASSSSTHVPKRQRKRSSLHKLPDLAGLGREQIARVITQLRESPELLSDLKTHTNAQTRDLHYFFDRVKCCRTLQCEGGATFPWAPHVVVLNCRRQKTTNNEETINRRPSITKKPPTRETINRKQSTAKKPSTKQNIDNEESINVCFFRWWFLSCWSFSDVGFSRCCFLRCRWFSSLTLALLTISSFLRVEPLVRLGVCVANSHSASDAAGVPQASDIVRRVAASSSMS